jgi:hypothetical protein
VLELTIKDVNKKQREIRINYGKTGVVTMPMKKREKWLQNLFDATTRT